MIVTDRPLEVNYIIELESNVEHEDLNRKIIAGVIERNPQGRDLGVREKARVADMARTLWRGDKGVGQAVREATDIVRSER